jgi:hypothetical protein
MICMDSAVLLHKTYCFERSSSGIRRTKIGHPVVSSDVPKGKLSHDSRQTVFSEHVTTADKKCDVIIFERLQA